MLLQFDLKHIHKVNFYPSDNNFTQALLVLLVTNMISGHRDLEAVFLENQNLCHACHMGQSISVYCPHI